VDWWETPLADLFPLLRRDRNIALEQMNFGKSASCASTICKAVRQPGGAPRAGFG
jgi:hypothetical protein